jgi:hypothetical protein
VSLQPVFALLEVRIEDRLAGRAPARLGTLENELFPTNPSDEMLYEAFEITHKEGSTTVAVPPPRGLERTRSPPFDRSAEAHEFCQFR